MCQAQPIVRVKQWYIITKYMHLMMNVKQNNNNKMALIGSMCMQVGVYVCMYVYFMLNVMYYSFDVLAYMCYFTFQARINVACNSHYTVTKDIAESEFTTTPQIQVNSLSFVHCFSYFFTCFILFVFQFQNMMFLRVKERERAEREREKRRYFV